MPSLISGFSFDIFISYRQKDNRSARWVTHFVQHLQEELDATLKDELSIYFDENPHDGLSELHEVQQSLQAKLKAVIFMPILSRTYADERSFAYQHEFLPFIRNSRLDQIGPNVRLANGNLVNRVLPVIIHDLDLADRRTIERDMDTPLRGIEFIYQEPGVNRPLNPDDRRQDNLRSTIYQNQLNKVAIVIKYIVQALTQTDLPPVTQTKQNSPRSIPQTTNSVLVLPFVNLSNDPEQEYFSDGLTEEIINDLSRIPSLQVISRSSAMTFKGSSKKITDIGNEINVLYILEGSVRKHQQNLRITARLVDVKRDAPLWSQIYAGTLDDVFDIQEKVAKAIAAALKIELSTVDQLLLIDRSIKNVKAYDTWISAIYEFRRFSPASIEKGIKLVQHALNLEGPNARLLATLSYFYWAAYDFGLYYKEGTLELVDSYASQAIALDPASPQALFAKGLNYYKKGDILGFLRLAHQSFSISNETEDLSMFSFVLAEVGLSVQALPYVEKALKNDPLIFLPWWSRAAVYMFEGLHDEAVKTILEAQATLAPSEAFAGWWAAQMLAYQGDHPKAILELTRIANFGEGIWSDFCQFLKLALEKQREPALTFLQSSRISDYAMTDEYYPLFIANGLTVIGEYEQALTWLERGVAWGFCNTRFLQQYNPFLQPLLDLPRFKQIVKSADQQQAKIRDALGFE